MKSTTAQSKKKNDQHCKRTSMGNKQRKTHIGKIYKKFHKRISNWKSNTNKDIGESAGNQRLRIITMNMDDFRSTEKRKKQLTV